MLIHGNLLLARQFGEAFFWTWMGESTELGMYVLSSKQYTWMTSTWVERSRIWLLCGRNWWKPLILVNLHHLLIPHIWDVLNVNANRMELLLTKIQRCLEHVFPLEQLNNHWDGRSLTQRRWPGPTRWKDMLENALNDIVNWQTRKWSSFSKYQVFAWMNIGSNRKNSNLSENYHKYAH